MSLITRFWRIGADAGGDGTEDTDSSGDNSHAYQTLSALEAAEDQDLTNGQGDTFHAITTKAGIDSVFVNWTGWTTSADDHVTIEAQGDARHNGISRESSGVGYSLRTGDSNGSLLLQESFIRLKGIEIAQTVNSQSALRWTSDNAGDRFFMDECLLVATDTGSGSSPPWGYKQSGQLVITNCLTLSRGHYMTDCRTAGAITIDHCGFRGTRNLGVLLDATCTITNSYAVGASSEDFWTGGTAVNGSHCASLDNSAATDLSDTVDIVTLAAEFTDPDEDPASNDMTLLDSLLVEAGTGSEPIDITGAARTGTADIGPFNFAAAASELVEPPRLHPFAIHRAANY